jgi:hypothetical protein
MDGEKQLLKLLKWYSGYKNSGYKNSFSSSPDHKYLAVVCRAHRTYLEQ